MEELTEILHNLEEQHKRLSELERAPYALSTAFSRYALSELYEAITDIKLAIDEFRLQEERKNEQRTV